MPKLTAQQLEALRPKTIEELFGVEPLDKAASSVDAALAQQVQDLKKANEDLTKDKADLTKANADLTTGYEKAFTDLATAAIAKGLTQAEVDGFKFTPTK